MRAAAAPLRGKGFYLPVHLNGRLVAVFSGLPVVLDDLLDRQVTEQVVSKSDHLVFLYKTSRRAWESAKTHLGPTDLVDTSLDISDDQVVQGGSIGQRVSKLNERLEEVDQGRVRV
jgi:hypothetical protein